MQLRWKVALLMLTIALGPLAVTAWMDIRALRTLGGDLAAQSAQALTDNARDSLEQLADDHARLVLRERQLVEALIRQQAREAESLLNGQRLADPDTVHFLDDFTKSPPDLLLSERARYRRLDESGVEVPIPVSFDHAVFQVPMDVEQASVSQDARKLVPLTQLLADIQDRYTDLIYWQYMALENGLNMSFPGHGALPADYDARQRSWYTGQRAATDLQWSTPITDAASRQRTVGVTMPLRDANGEFAGVSGIDVLLVDMLQALSLPEHLDAASQILLINLQRNAQTGEPFAAILAQRDAARYGADWRELFEMVPLQAGTPAGTGRLVDAMVTDSAATLRLPYRGADAFWVFRSFGDAENFLLLIVPVSAAVAPALDAAAYALHTTQRRVDEMLPLTLVVSCLVVGISLLVSRSVTSPVHQLSDAVDAIALGDFQAKVSIATGDELERLGDAFNTMLPRLEEHARMTESMALAREVQTHLLPNARPDLPDLDIDGACEFCDDTGGDYFDYLDLRGIKPGLLGVVIGDVSGHGLPSALLMTSARALVHGLANQLVAPRQMFSRINEQLVKDFALGRFMTLFYLTIDCDARQLRWASAGHAPALCYNTQTYAFRELAGQDIPLGIQSGWEFGNIAEGPWSEHDIIVLHTDGLLETRNADAEEFGRDRLRNLVRAHHTLSATQLCRTVMDEVRTFRGDQPQRDDVTLVVIKGRAR
ncbi:MAG: SpoIIE family protein phosphatase [Gammaproteobacteria bacterium]|nr:SpoIIE family protein phosphatase [Gammaproteobacteria bacterium]